MTKKRTMVIKGELLTDELGIRVVGDNIFFYAGVRGLGGVFQTTKSELKKIIGDINA